MNNNTIYSVNLNDVSTTRVQIPTQTGTVDINYASGHFQTVQPVGGSITLNFVDGTWPTSGSYGWIRVQFIITSTAYTVTLPSAVNVGTDNLQGYDPSTYTITFNKPGTYVYEFTSYNAGTSITVFDLSQNADPIYLPSSEQLANSAAVSLATTATIIATTGAETATIGRAHV